jgi:hypothetical protein
MRWDGLFDDLEAHSRAMEAADRGVEVGARTRAELADLALGDRLGSAVGSELTLRCLGGAAVSGTLRRASVEWLLLTESAGRDAVVATRAVCTIAGLPRRSAGALDPAAIESRLGLRHALRGIARDRSVMRAHLIDGSVLDGTIDRVGQNFIEIAVHGAGEVRRRSEVRQVLVVLTEALAVVRRDG